MSAAELPSHTTAPSMEDRNRDLQREVARLERRIDILEQGRKDDAMRAAAHLARVMASHEKDISELKEDLNIARSHRAASSSRPEGALRDINDLNKVVTAHVEQSVQREADSASPGPEPRNLPLSL